MAIDDNQSVGSHSVFTTHFSDSHSATGQSRSSGDASSSNDEELRRSRGNQKKTEDIAQKEARAVFKAKILLYMVLIATALLSFFGIYSLGVQQDVDHMHSVFEGHTSEIIGVTTQKVEKVLDALDAFACSISSQAAESKQYTNQSWPFLKIPQWTQRAAKLAESSGFKSPAVAFAPIVGQSELAEWESYFASEAPINYQDILEDAKRTTTSFVHSINPNDPVDHNGLYLPILQKYPLHQHLSESHLSVGLDLMSDDQTRTTFDSVRSMGSAVISIDNQNTEGGIQGSYLMQPVYDEDILVGVLLLQVKWEDFLENLVPEGTGTIDVVVKTTCANEMENILSEVTFELNGPSVRKVGNGDLHQTDEFSDMAVVHTLIETAGNDPIIAESRCIPKISMYIYPTQDFEQSSEHKINAELKAVAAFIIFLCPTIFFLIYDFLVTRRQRKYLDRIAQQDAIVSNVFPTAIRNRLYDRDGDNHGEKKVMNSDDYIASASRNDGAPLADLFPNTTVMFADIAGFTAWASAREPQQVFMLLESIYVAFDKIAYRQGVFKVETVGDCYVAVCGLPEPCEDHAVVACKFARDCLRKMKVLTRKLEVTLGPDTADLDLRVGIHSGQVTAGVLRGDRNRFQLFGDTVNTAARMESTGERNRIQMSQATADLLQAAGWGQWAVPRSETVYIKGKGDMQTYWMQFMKKSRQPSSRNLKKASSDLQANLSTLDETVRTAEDNSSLTSETDHNLEGDEDGEEGDEDKTLGKTERLVEWNVEILTSLLQQIIASREGHESPSPSSLASLESSIGKSGTVLEEFVPIIPLKRFNETELRKRRNAHTIDIEEEAKSQLRRYLKNIASMYQDNPFHNFEHASHVTASVKKLLKRIVNVDEGNGLGGSSHHSTTNFDLADLAGHSYGITSDPLTQFAVVFSAIIHDVDHPGVPNAQLVKENTRNAQIYKNKSVAEQNSVELAWEMLMCDEFRALRACIYQTPEELKRFRQLVVNTVMATDIVDKELQALRKSRWDKAFSETSTDEDGDDTKSDDRKATIVIEHLIQASDVSHTMQHWHIYKQWNQKFFMECYGAYKAGRADVDPSISWYNGEIGFFDFYVIPLAKKLDSCGVFGVSSDEYLEYAMANREEWAREGKKLVESFKEAYEAEYGTKREDKEEGVKEE